MAANRLFNLPLQANAHVDEFHWHCWSNQQAAHVEAFDLFCETAQHDAHVQRRETHKRLGILALRQPMHPEWFDLAGCSTYSH